MRGQLLNSFCAWNTTHRNVCQDAALLFKEVSDVGDALFAFAVLDVVDFS